MEITLLQEEIEEMDIDCLLYFFLLIHPAATAHKIYKYWGKDKVLSDYERPEQVVIEKVVSAFQREIEERIFYRD